MNTIYRNGSNYIKIIKANFSYTILYNNIYFIKDKKINKIWKYINQQKKEEFKVNMKGEKGKNMRNKGITLIALVITIVLNSSYLAMARMNKFEKI